MRAVALTDHGTVAGIIKFLRTCRASDIRPVLGCEMYMARNYLGKTKEEQPDRRRGNRHLNVFAKNFKGYQNLCRLAQKSSVDGYYYDPRIDFQLLADHREGLMCSSACLSNVVNANLLVGRYEQAKQAASAFKDVFDDDYYLEVMYHGLDKESQIIPDILKLGKELGIKVIATNDNHYSTSEDARFHEVLICMSSNRCIKDPRRISFPYGEFFFKTQQQMAEVFGPIPSVLTNTLEVAEKCDYSELRFVDEEGGVMRLPHFEVPTTENPYDYLHRKAWEGLRTLGLDKSERHRQRLETELSDIKLAKDVNHYDFDVYMLIVADIVEEARRRNIPCGIRGSGCGSLILYCLGVTEGVDPVEFELLWERFLGFERRYYINEADFDE